jgi:hypothetical protein
MRLFLWVALMIPRVLLSWSQHQQQQKGKDLLKSLIAGDASNSNVPAVARPGISLDHLSLSSAAAVRQIWEHGSLKFLNGVLLADTQKQQLLCRGRCQLVSGDDGNSAFQITSPLESLLATAFESVLESMALYGFNTQLSHYDLFHGHLF